MKSPTSVFVATILCLFSLGLCAAGLDDYLSDGPVFISDVKVERFIRGPLDLLSVIFISRFRKRPMHFFGMMGAVVFLLGFIILGYLSVAKLVYLEYGITERPLFYLGLISLIIGSQLFLTGFLAELIVRSGSDRNHYLIEQRIGEQHEQA